jgi:hypothetical protein
MGTPETGPSPKPFDPRDFPAPPLEEGELINNGVVSIDPRLDKAPPVSDPSVISLELPADDPLAKQYPGPTPGFSPSREARFEETVGDN